MSKIKHFFEDDEEQAPNDNDELESVAYLDEVTGEYRTGTPLAKHAVISANSVLDNNNIDDDDDYQHAADEGAYEIEYIVENDDGDDDENEAKEVDKLEGALSKHTLLCKQDDAGNESYSCMECGIAYENVDEFTLSHTVCDDDEFLDADEVDEAADIVQETQWEALDELPNEHDDDNDDADDDDAKSETKEDIEHILYKDDTVTLPTEEEEEVTASSMEDDEVEEVENENDGDGDGDGDGDADKFFCIECQIVFSDLESAEQHECTATNEKTDGNESNDEKKDETSKSGKAREFKCLHCPRVFASVNALCSHSRTHKAKGKGDKCQELVTCNICNTNFNSEKNLKFHMRIHDKRPAKSIQDALPPGAKLQYRELNQFFCEICNKSFDQNLLVIHKNMHQNVEEFICGICNRQFENLLNYEMHMKMHEDKDKKKCPPVSKSKHLRNDGKLRFPCQYCGHEFARPYEKVKHERVHTGEKPYECEVCGKTFRVAYSLTLHLRTHTNIRPYVCATCNKRFKSQPVYTHHLMTHKSERTFKCDQCPKTFRTAVQLCGHKNSHKKPFSCPECNRPFSALYAVKVHMKTHEKHNKPSAKTKKASKETDTVKLRCGFCGALYTRMFALRTHMKEHHNMEMEPNQRIERVQNSDDEETFLITAGGGDDDDEMASESPPPPPVKQEPERRVMRINKNKNKVGRPPKVKSNIVVDTNDHDILLASDDIMMDASYKEEIIGDDDDEWLPA